MAQLLDLVALTPSELPHPADLLTIEHAATHAEVSATTVDSAISSAAEFRQLSLEHAIRSLSTAPGPSVWTALQDTIGPAGAQLDLGLILAARAQELADDPALPLFLSGFARLENPSIQLAVNDVLCRLVIDLWPFVQTVYAAFGERCPLVPTADFEFVGLVYLLSDAMRRALFPAADPSDDQRISDIVLSLLQETIEAGPPLAKTTLFPVVDPIGHKHSTGVAADALTAAVDLLRSGQIPPSTTLSVADAAKRCGVSVSTFYRTFSSIGEFESQLFRRAEVLLSGGFTTDFLFQVLEEMELQQASAEVNAAEQPVETPIAYFVSRVLEQQNRHIVEGRPGLEIVPWLHSTVLGPLVRRSLRARFEERGRLLTKLFEVTGSQPRVDLDGASLAAVLGTLSTVFELLLRNSPDPRAAAASMEPGKTMFIAKIFAPAAG